MNPFSEGQSCDTAHSTPPLRESSLVLFYNKILKMSLRDYLTSFYALGQPLINNFGVERVLIFIYCGLRFNNKFYNSQYIAAFRQCSPNQDSYFLKFITLLYSECLVDMWTSYNLFVNTHDDIRPIFNFGFTRHIHLSFFNQFF